MFLQGHFKILFTLPSIWGKLLHLSTGMTPATPACALLSEVETIERYHARVCMETEPASHPLECHQPDGLDSLMLGRGHLRAAVVIAADATQITTRVHSTLMLLST